MANDEMARRLWRALLDAYGGEEVAAMVDEHYRHGRTLAAIAAERGVAPSTVCKRIARLRGALAAHGLLPRPWQSRDRVHVSRTANKPTLSDRSRENEAMKT